MSQRLFKKGDRVRFRKKWGLKCNTGTVIKDQEYGDGYVSWHVDQFPYTSGDLHEHLVSELELISNPSLSKSSTTGCICRKCKTPNEFAAPNQSDGSYLCFECRS